MIFVTKVPLALPNFIKVDKCVNLKMFRPYRMTFAPEQHEMVHATQRKSHCIFIVIYTPILCKKHFKTIFGRFVTNYIKIFCKTKVQTVILRCLLSQNLKWVKSYNIISVKDISWSARNFDDIWEKSKKTQKITLPGESRDVNCKSHEIWSCLVHSFWNDSQTSYYKVVLAGCISWPLGCYFLEGCMSWPLGCYCNNPGVSSFNILERLYLMLCYSS